MTLEQILVDQREAILDGALQSMNRAHLRHYEASGEARTRDQLAACYDLIHRSIVEKRLEPLLEHIERIARERFSAGYDLSEVQTAVNVLEEAIWRRIAEDVPGAGLAKALGLVSTVIGAAKDKLGRTYVELAGKVKAPSLDLQSLFSGVGT